jgi:threonine dehydratase
MNAPSPQDVYAARERIKAKVVHTPMLRNPRLDEAVGGTVLIKPECLQRTGTFKFRGATNAIALLNGAERARGVVAFSSGNHAQGIAAASRAAGIKATIFMPSDAPAIKIESTRYWGAEVILYDRQTEDRQALGAAFAERTGAVLVPPYDYLPVLAGQGTLALELIEDAKAAGLAMDALAAPAGGGGLISGCALAVEGKSPTTKVYAVEPEDWADTGASLAAGKRVAVKGGSLLCDSLLPPIPGEITFAVNQRLLAGAFAVTDAEVFAAMRFAFAHLKLVVEPGGSVALAAALAGKLDARGKVVGVVLSGGNVDPAVFQRALAG